MAADGPIIIGGSHRSGTTLLRRLLNGHPRIFCPPEIKFHKDLLGQFPEDPLAHGRLGSSIRALGLPTEIWLDEFGRALKRCYDIAALRAGKARWADKNPENALNVDHWERLLDGRMVFVLVVRHPLDVIASMAEIAMNKVIPVDVVGRACHVRDYVNAGLDFVERHQERSLIVHYERLVTEPQTTLNEVMRLAGEEYDEAMISGVLSDHHGQGLEDPKARRHARISMDNVGRWRKDLALDDVRLATPIIVDLCNRLGYELE
jgi:Sulfotransferase family